MFFHNKQNCLHIQLPSMEQYNEYTRQRRKLNPRSKRLFHVIFKQKHHLFKSTIYLNFEYYKKFAILYYIKCKWQSQTINHSPTQQVRENIKTSLIEQDNV